MWLPGSQTELAVVTADFIKINDLSQDAISPQYYFLLPTGKVYIQTYFFVPLCLIEEKIAILGRKGSVSE